MNKISLKRVVYVDQETGHICSCQGDFYKTCPLRNASALDCFEAVVTISKVTDSGKNTYPNFVTSLSKRIKL